MSSLSQANSLPSLWTPQFDTKQIKVEVPELQEPASDLFLRSILQRKHQKFGDEVKMNMEIHGIYSIPELWKNKVVSAS